MKTRIADLVRELRHLNTLIGQLIERVETLEDQNLDKRIGKVEKLANR